MNKMNIQNNGRNVSDNFSKKHPVQKDEIVSSHANFLWWYLEMIARHYLYWYISRWQFKHGEHRQSESLMLPITLPLVSEDGYKAFSQVVELGKIGQFLLISLKGLLDMLNLKVQFKINVYWYVACTFEIFLKYGRSIMQPS